jgi:hypothetical protein
MSSYAGIINGDSHPKNETFVPTEGCANGISYMREYAKDSSGNVTLTWRNLSDGSTSNSAPSGFIIGACGTNNAPPPEIDIITSNWMPFISGNFEQWYSRQEYRVDNATGVATLGATFYKKGVDGTETNVAPRNILREGYLAEPQYDNEAFNWMPIVRDGVQYYVHQDYVFIKENPDSTPGFFGFTPGYGNFPIRTLWKEGINGVINDAANVPIPTGTSGYNSYDGYLRPQEVPVTSTHINVGKQGVAPSAVGTDWDTNQLLTNPDIRIVSITYLVKHKGDPSKMYVIGNADFSPNSRIDFTADQDGQSYTFTVNEREEFLVNMLSFHAEGSNYFEIIVTTRDIR